MVVVLVVPRLIDVDRYRPRLEQAIEDATGWDAELGELRLSVLRGLKVSVDLARLSASDGGSSVEIERIDVAALLGPLLRGRLEVQSVELVEPRIEIVRPSAEAGWDVPMPEPDVATAGDAGGAGGGGMVDVSIDSVTVRGGALRIEDRSANPPLEIALSDVDLDIAPTTGSFRGDAELPGSGRIEVSGETSAAIEITLAELPSESLVAWIGPGLLLPGARIDGAVQVRWPEVGARFSATDLRILEGNAPLGPTNVSFDLNASDGTVSFEVDSSGLVARGSGVVFPDLALEVVVPDVPLGTVLEIAGAVATLPPLGIEPPGTVTATAELRRGAGQPLAYRASGHLAAARFAPGSGLPTIDELDTDFRLSGSDGLVLEPLRGRVAEGPLTGRVTLDRLVPAGVLRIEGQLEQAALGLLLAGFAGEATEQVRGPVALDLDVALDLGSPEIDATSLRGGLELDARMIVVEGWNLAQAVRETLREKLGGLGELAELIERRRGRGEVAETAPESQRILEQLSGRLVFAGPRWNVEDLELRSGGLTASGSGGFDPRSGVVELALTAILDAQESAELIERERRLRVLADDQGRLRLPLTVAGPVGAPSIGVNLDELADDPKERAVEGLLRNLFDR